MSTISTNTPHPSFMGVPLKFISLATLTLQNSSLTILLHYSRTSTPPDKTYSAAAAVLLNELLKGSISFVIALRNTYGQEASLSPLEAGRLIPTVVNEDRMGPHRRKVSDMDSVPSWSDSSTYAFGGKRSMSSQLRLLWTKLRQIRIAIFSPDCWKLSIPAILYVIQNNLQFVAAANLDPATFQISYQMKIMTTAFFSVLLLRKKLSVSKWASLFALALGVGIVQLQSSSATGHGGNGGGVEMKPLTGFLAVACACMTSGLAGVYFEMVLKGSTTDLWVRNVQLSLFSLVPAFLAAFTPDFSTLGSSNVDPIIPTEPRRWLFANFGFWAWAVVLNQVMGGLVTALVIKFSDNILKGFATSLSIVISFLAGVLLFGFEITTSFVVGCSVVLAATYAYNRPASDGGKDATRGGYQALPRLPTSVQRTNSSSQLASSPSAYGHPIRASNDSTYEMGTGMEKPGTTSSSHLTSHGIAGRKQFDSATPQQGVIPVNTNYFASTSTSTSNTSGYASPVLRKSSPIFNDPSQFAEAGTYASAVHVTPSGGPERSASTGSYRQNSLPGTNVANLLSMATDPSATHAQTRSDPSSIRSVNGPNGATLSPAKTPNGSTYGPTNDASNRSPSSPSLSVAGVGLGFGKAGSGTWTGLAPMGNRTSPGLSRRGSGSQESDAVLASIE